MPTDYQSAFNITGTPQAIAGLHVLLDALKPKDKVFSGIGWRSAARQ